MTENNNSIILTARTLIRISGADAAHFLQNIITTDIDQIAEGDMYAGALLSPQGKVMFDFLVGHGNGQFFIDISDMLAADFIKRLALYKLRSEVKIEKQNHNIITIFLQKDLTLRSSDSAIESNLLIFNDKRLNRQKGIIRTWQISNKEQPIVNHQQKWDMIRIENGIAESGSDFTPGTVFPHDINYDQINGLSFTKGCYIGQEVVSRMQHRSTARRRVLVASGAGSLPPTGTEIEAKGKPVGVLGTVVGAKAIALARIDRVKAAMDAGHKITAGGVALDLTIPDNVHFTFSSQRGDSN